jgi:hypothetical protein
MGNNNLIRSTFDACVNGPEKSSSFDLAMNLWLLAIQKFVRKLRLGRFRSLSLIQLGSLLAHFEKLFPFRLLFQISFSS